MGRGAHYGVGRTPGHLQPLWDDPLSHVRDRDHMNIVGEPYSGKPNVRIDEGRPGRTAEPVAYSTDPRGHLRYWDGSSVRCRLRTGPRAPAGALWSGARGACG